MELGEDVAFKALEEEAVQALVCLAVELYQLARTPDDARNVV